MKTEIVLLRDILGGWKGISEKLELQEAIVEVKEEVVPSASEIVEMVLEEDEPREDEGVGLRAQLLPKPPPEALAPPVLEA